MYVSTPSDACASRKMIRTTSPKTFRRVPPAVLISTSCATAKSPAAYVHGPNGGVCAGSHQCGCQLSWRENGWMSGSGGAKDRRTSGGVVPGGELVEEYLDDGDARNR